MLNGRNFLKKKRDSSTRLLAHTSLSLCVRRGGRLSEEVRSEDSSTHVLSCGTTVLLRVVVSYHHHMYAAAIIMILVL